MKKFLIATTALTLSAGVAAAEVKFGGDARLGLQYNSEKWGNGSKTALEKRMTVNIDASTTADNGVTFGARVRIRSDEGTGTGLSGARVFARFGGLTVAGGNILGAIESMPGLYAPSLGLTGLAYTGLVTNVGLTGGAGYDQWDAFTSRANGAEGIEVLYSAGDFSGHLSVSTNDLNRSAAATPDTRRVAAWGAYNVQGWTLALGLQDSKVEAEDKIILSATGKVGDFGVGVHAARNGKGDVKVNKFALNGSYAFGATTVSAFVAAESGHGSAIVLPANYSKTTYGLGASYDLGGGASVVGGIARTVEKETRADLGVSFRF